MTGQLGLGKPLFEEFCEGLNMLEFYGMVKVEYDQKTGKGESKFGLIEPVPKPGYSTKVVCSI